MHSDSVSSGRFGVGYAHPSQEMDNTVFPPAHSAYGLELLKATKFPQWTNLKKPLFPVTSRGQLGWPPPTKEDGPYQVARTGLHVKLERIVLQVGRGAEATQGSIHAQDYNECNKAEKSCWKIVQHGLSTATGWSSATKALGQDTLISPPCSHFQWWRGHTKSSRP